MKAVLIYAIKLYWSVWPEHRRRSCLFRESCSHHIYRVTKEAGLIHGLNALRYRFRACRKGYKFLTTCNGVELQLVDGTKLTSIEASPHLFLPFENAGNQIRQKLLKSRKPTSAANRVTQTVYAKATPTRSHKIFHA